METPSFERTDNQKTNNQPLIVERIHAGALGGESFEDATIALQSVEALQDFRKKTSQLPFGSFWEAVEEITNIQRVEFSFEERSNQIERVVEALEERAGRFSPRVADLYLGILYSIRELVYAPKFEITGGKFQELQLNGDLQVLFSSNYSWEMKLNRIETRLLGYLSGARALDKREGKEMDDDIRKWREEELKKAPSHPTERRNEAGLNVTPLDRLKEGERVPAIWTIEPGFSRLKYFKTQSFSKFDPVRNVWFEDEYEYHDPKLLPLLEKEDPQKGLVNVIMKSRVNAGMWISCPVPYTHGLHKVEVRERDYFVQQDQNGDLVILIEGEGEVEVKVVLAAKEDRRLATELPRNPAIPNMLSEFTEDTNKKLAEIRNRGRGNVARARMLSAYARSRIGYTIPKNIEEANLHNDLYNDRTLGFGGAVDKLRKGDCKVVNTYFATLCTKLNIPVRRVNGHTVKGKNENGASEINWIGHAWSEVWDEIRKEWVLIDATPAGDPNLEDDKEQGGVTPPGYVAGDDIEQEAVRPSDEKLEELRQKLAEQKEQLSYTKEERQLAEATGVELKEARKIVKEISKAEQTRLPNGELVVDALAKLFNSIVESRRVPAFGYTGPVRQSEGGEEIENIVEHYVQAKSGEMDPRSRELPTQETKEDKILGGFDLFNICDKSGSMRTTSEEGETLLQMQRRAKYLTFSALYRFERNLERAGLPKENTLSVRTQSTSFRGNDPKEDIDLDKSLSSQFTAEDKVKLWHSLTEQGSGNGDPEALSAIYEQIKEDVEELKKRGVKDNRLRLIIAFSDGGYVGNDAVKMQGLAKKIYELNANTVLVGLGLTQSAANVPVVMDNPPYSYGEVVADINDLPAFEAKYLVLEAIKLFPEKTQDSARQVIESSIAKFNSIK